jgi:uncharacterized protein
MLVRLRSSIARPAQEVFGWFLLPAAVERAFPPWRKIKLVSKEGKPDEEGFRFTCLIKIGPFWRRWIVQRRELNGSSFTQAQIEGPFARWEHRYEVHAAGDAACTLTEEVSFDLAIPFFARKIERELTFWAKWRSQVIEQDLFCYARYKKKTERILVSGSTGLIGSSLIPFLRNAGFEVIRLVRSRKAFAEDAVYWDPMTGDIDKEQFENFDAVIHLAGENVASGLWTKRKKERIFLSRCRDTWLLSHVLLRLYRPPKTMISASAIGFYGSRIAEEVLTEESKSGEGFFSDLCTRWEAATQTIENRGTRVAHTRFGPILAPLNGLLGNFLPLLRWNLGATLGSGRQIMSWIAIDDVVGALFHVLSKEEISGPVNVVAPYPVTQKEFLRDVTKRIHRIAPLQIPAAVLRFFFKEMADELFLSGQNVKPEKLLKTGYAFRYPHLEEALDHFLR